MGTSPASLRIPGITIEPTRIPKWAIATSDDGAHLTLFEEGKRPVHLCHIETDEQKKAVKRFLELAELSAPEPTADSVPGPDPIPGTCPDCLKEYDQNEDRCPQCHRWTGR